MSRRLWIGVLLLLACSMGATENKQPTKGLLFFYRSGNWVDHYLMRDVDTAYIRLPEHSWRAAFTSGTSGVNYTIHSTSTIDGLPGPITLSLYNRTPLSVDLGFNVGYRGFGFGYSWDVLNAYARRISFSFGSKFLGLDFSHQTSTNARTDVGLNGTLLPSFSNDNKTSITNTKLNVWYALNAAHYSHNAAVKQSFIQCKTAGSLLLHLSYLASQIAFGDTVIIKEAEMPTLQALMSGVSSMTTRQVAVGIGYGINYTPNHGKVLLHASASAMLVCYSVNHIGYYIPDSTRADYPGEPIYVLRSAKPVHVTGNVRAAVSWEINRWVHLSAWAIGDNIRFRSEKTATNNELYLSDWNWKVQLTVGVRLGAGRDRVQQALHDTKPLSGHHPHDHLPLWLTDFFWSPK